MSTAERDEFAWVVAALRCHRAALLPPGWEDGLLSYDEMMAWVGAMSDEERAAVDAEVARLDEED